MTAHTRTEFKVVSQSNQTPFEAELNKLGLGGWKLISFSTIQTSTSPITFTAILERPLAG